MRKTEKFFIDEFNTYLKKHGFIKKGSYWKKQISDYWIILNLEKSQYGKYFYLNVGISTNHFNNLKVQKTYHWSLATRYETIFGLDNQELIKLFDYSADEKNIQNNIKVISKNLDFLLQIFYKLNSKSFIEKHFDELFKSFNISHFSMGNLQKIIQKD